MRLFPHPFKNFLPILACVSLIICGAAKFESVAAEEKPETTELALPPGLSVNADLWRATLDTLSFMPLASTDPVGGVIITDWYNAPKTPAERFKINAVISGLELRADAVRVAVFRQRQRRRGWVSIAATPHTARQLENIILTRARDFVRARRAR